LSDVKKQAGQRAVLPSARRKKAIAIQALAQSDGEPIGEQKFLTKTRQVETEGTMIDPVTDRPFVTTTTKTSKTPIRREIYKSTDEEKTASAKAMIKNEEKLKEIAKRIKSTGDGDKDEQLKKIRKALDELEGKEEGEDKGKEEK
jgi:hypothetical protein